MRWGRSTSGTGLRDSQKDGWKVGTRREARSGSPIAVLSTSMRTSQKSIIPDKFVQKLAVHPISIFLNHLPRISGSLSVNLIEHLRTKRHERQICAMKLDDLYL